MFGYRCFMLNPLSLFPLLTLGIISQDIFLTSTFHRLSKLWGEKRTGLHFDCSSGHIWLFLEREELFSEASEGLGPRWWFLLRAPGGGATGTWRAGYGFALELCDYE